MKKDVYVFVVLVLLCVSFSGCNTYQKSVTDEERADLAKPIDCNTAVEDIKTLEDERSSIEDQLAAGVKSVIPVSAVRAILHGDYADRAMVAVGEYNFDINKKIKEIKNECGLSK